MSLRPKSVLLVLCVLSGCSVYMESTRPTPVDLATFHPGDSRTSIVEQFGAPVTTTYDARWKSCDLYLLYITGYGDAGKLPIAIAEGAADVFTLGLAEIVLSPTEAATRNEKKPVWFCYKDQSLLSVTPSSVEGATPMPSASPPFASTAIPSPAASLAASAVPSGSPTPTVLAVPVPSSPAASSTPTAAPANKSPAPGRI